jgi:hypothetical protein
MVEMRVGGQRKGEWVVLGLWSLIGRAISAVDGVICGLWV